MIGSALVESHATNQIVMDPALKDQNDVIEFCTVGAKGHFNLWMFN